MQVFLKSYMDVNGKQESSDQFNCYLGGFFFFAYHIMYILVMTI